MLMIDALTQLIITDLITIDLYLYETLNIFLKTTFFPLKFNFVSAD